MRSRGMTLIEVCVLLVFVGAVLAWVYLVPSLGRSGNGGPVHPRSVATRHIHQAMVGFAQDNADRYQLPSELDAGDATVRERGAAKNTTANIFSILVWHGALRPEDLIDPGERGHVVAMSGYEFSEPRSAVQPRWAQWDPALSADFTASKPGNVSWAHLQPVGPRLDHWNTTSTSWTRPIVSTRGPDMSGSHSAPGWMDPRSIHVSRRDGRSEWSGMVVYGDGHVNWLKEPFAIKRERPNDALFLDELEDTLAENDFLGVFTTAGSVPWDFRAIWD